MRITATFLDEISHDIPHQNWGEREWDRDFQAMKSIGIDTVVLIRSGYRRWMTYPSQVLAKRENCYMPPVDLVDMYLRLSEKYGMKFFFGLYDSGRYWANAEWEKEVDINLAVIDEVWKKYGHSKAFGGWYLSQEVSRRTGSIAETYAKMGRHCKEVSNNLPTMISPYIDGCKNVYAFDSVMSKDKKQGLLPEEHEREWNGILSTIENAVDIVAFQDGHVDYDELSEYLEVNMKLTQKYGMRCWTNCESFDRDMPIKFLPIKWEKMLLKLEAAKVAKIEKAITFEFSHFMSPNSSYLQAHGLFDRYCEHFNIFK